MSIANEQSRPQAAHGLEVPFGALRDVYDEIRRSLRPKPDEAWLTAGELVTARRNRRFTIIFMVLAGLVVAETCAPWVPLSIRAGWTLVIALLAVGLNRVMAYLDRLPLETAEEVRRRAYWQTGVTIFYLLAWCSMSVFLWAPGVLADHMLIELILAVSLSGSVSMGAVHPATVLAVIVTHAVFMIVPFALSHLPVDHTLAILSVFFASTRTIQSVVLHKSQKKLLTLEHERSGLVEGLRIAKEESDRDRERAQAAGRAKSEFLSNMSHELRTPMNAILGFSEIIEQKALGDAVDKYAEYAGIIHESGRNLLRLIDDVLDLAKIEGGKLSLRESEVSIADLMGEILNEYSERATSAELSLSTECDPRLPSVRADPRALRQILVNLVSNSLKFTPRGGKIVLFARHTKDGRLRFGVGDSGIGIAAQDQNRVFESFGEGRHDVTNHDKGTGVGLAIVKGFAEAHDGDVTLESTLGSGARFTVNLPAERVLASKIRKSA